MDAIVSSFCLSLKALTANDVLYTLFQSKDSMVNFRSFCGIVKRCW